MELCSLRGGTVDLEKSEGILYGSGNVQVLDGRVIKKSYSVNKNNSSICLEAKKYFIRSETERGNRFPEDKVEWFVPVEGTWQFVKGDLVPQAGTSNQDIVFVPKYPMTYDSLFFTKSGKITVNTVTPRRQDEKEVQIFAGQNLTKIHPDLTYVSPVTGEKVAVSLPFLRMPKTMVLENMRFRACFRHRIKNYQSVTDTVVVDVVSVKPEQVEPPVVRNHGTYGDRLNQIRFLDGKYKIQKREKSSREVLSGKMAARPLKLGTSGYTMLFIPDGKGYEIVESEVLVETLPKEMEEFEWPSCSIFPLVRICRILLLVSRKMNMAFSFGRTRKFVHRLKIQVSMLCFVRQIRFGMTGARWRGMMRRQRQLHARFRLPCVR